MSTAQEPSKADIDAILKRLRSIATNKSCFDCGAKNPTWSSVTYGVFICIDCSATHRSLGVHLSFVRSTQLDTNWTWIQLRQMQLGGNANATAFFEQHNCTSKDAQQKYNSRAAQLYRENLHQKATKAQRTYGNKVHLDEGHKEATTTTKQDTDFFQEHTSSNSNGNQLFNTNFDSHLTEHIVDKSHEGPSVNTSALMGNNESASLSSHTAGGGSSTTDEVKSSILQKKQPAQAKKKGLGALKVQADFKEIERATQEMDKMKEIEVQEQAKSKEEAEKQMQKQMASMKLAYDNLDKQREKEEAKLKQVDPKKAEQLERLGMAVGNRNAGISHSALSDMQIIQQEGVYSAKPLNRQKDFFDEFESSYKTSSSSRGGGGYNDESMDFRGFGSSAATSSNSYKLDSDWVNVDEKYDKFDDNYLADKKSSNNYNKSSSNNNNDYSSTANNGDAMKRFANAKSISSDQYFGNRNSDSEQRNLSRFENSTSISSDDYFGNSSSNKYQKSGGSSSSNAGADLSMLKQDLKEGVSKAAGKLSNMASNLMTSLQDKL